MYQTLVFIDGDPQRPDLVPAAEEQAKSDEVWWWWRTGVHHGKQCSYVSLLLVHGESKCGASAVDVGAMGAQAAGHPVVLYNPCWGRLAKRPSPCSVPLLRFGPSVLSN